MKDSQRKAIHAKKRYFNVHFHNPEVKGNFEKLVSAPSDEYIKKNKSDCFGKGIKITHIDGKIYAGAKTEVGAMRMMRKRHGYKVVNGNRIYT